MPLQVKQVGQKNGLVEQETPPGTGAEKETTSPLEARSGLHREGTELQFGCVERNQEKLKPNLS